MRYKSWHCLLHRSSLESRISDISYSGSPLTSTGGRGGWIWLGMVFGVAVFNWDMWKTGWMECIESGSRTVMEYDPGWAIISNGPKFFSDSFLDRWVEQKYLAFMNTYFPTLKSRAGIRCTSAGPWYLFCTRDISSQRNRCSLLRSIA